MTDKEFVLSIYPDAILQEETWGCYVRIEMDSNKFIFPCVRLSRESAWREAKEMINEQIMRKLES